MKFWKLCAALAAVPLVVCAAVVALALDRSSALAERSDVAIGDVRHVLAIAKSHDPRRAEWGKSADVTVTARDLELLLNHAAYRRLGARVSVALSPGQAELTSSAPWAWGSGNSLGGWINLRARFKQAQGLPELQSWQVGALPLPTALAGPLLGLAAQRLLGSADLGLLQDVVRQVNFVADGLTVTYVWKPDTSQRLLAAMTPPAEQMRLLAYAELLAKLTAGDASATTVSMPKLIAPLFDLARQRSLHNDAALENRAAVLTLTMYVTGRNLAEMVPAARAWPQPRRLAVLLNGRDDFPQHFLVSAMLVIEGTSPLTNAVGLYKEVADANGGSGFSFNDLAANRAGLRFGQFAHAQPLRLQELLARGVTEASLMPDVADLPEFLSQAEFTRRYQRVGSADYKRLLDDIERRVGALTLYQ